MSTATLHIGTNSHGKPFTLPSDFVTQTAAVLARKRVGKTYTASVMAEEFAAAGIPFVVLDPTGAWWGLRSLYPVVIIGGSHGDVPLEPTAGKVIADLVVEHPGFYIIDLSQTASNAEQDRFAADFAERLYRAKEKHRFPLHLFVDEADSFAPQRPFPGQQRMLGAFEAIVRRGGIRGLGMTMITQRPAVLNKSVLTQAEMLVVLQMTGPQDQDAIEDWVKRNGTKEERDTMMASLASLQRGEAWVWSPSWLQCFDKISVRQRRTFNSSATPKPGEVIIAPDTIARVDLAALGKQIAETVERARENDPAALKGEIQRLKAEVAKKPAQAPAEHIEVKIPDAESLRQIAGRLNVAEVLFKEFKANIAPQLANMERVMIEVAMSAAVITRELNSFSGRGGPTPQGIPNRTDKGLAPAEMVSRGTVARAPAMHTSAGSLSKAERLILTALAQFGPSSKNKVAAVTGYAVNGGGFNNALSSLRTQLYITDGDPMDIRAQGSAALGEYDPLPSGQALIDMWLDRLGKAERRIFAHLCDVYPSAETKEALADAAGYEPSGGGFNNALSALRTLELITRGQEIKASDNLFSP